MFMAHEHEPHRPRLVVLYSGCCCIVVSVNFGTVFTFQTKKGNEGTIRLHSVSLNWNKVCVPPNAR